MCGAGLPFIERTKLEVAKVAPSLTWNIVSCVSEENNVNLERHSSNN